MEDEFKQRNAITRRDFQVRFAYKPSPLTLAVAGFAVVAFLAAISARYNGLGENEGFILYKLMGVSRRALAYFSLFLIAAAFAIEKIIKSDIKWRIQLPPGVNRLPGAQHPDRARPVIPVSDQSGIAAVVAISVSALFLTLAVFPRISPPRPLHHLPELVSAYDLADGSVQFHAHQIAVAFIALAVLLAGRLVRSGYKIFQFEKNVPEFMGAIVLAAPLLAWWLGLPTFLLVHFAFAVGCGALLLALLLLHNHRAATWIGVALVLVFCALIIVPGFTGPLIFFDNQPYDVAQLELHLTWMVQPSSVLASGFRLFDDFTPGYGVIVPILSAIFERHFGLLDVGGQLRLVQLSEVAFLLTAVAVFFRARRSLLPALLPLAIVGPYLTTAGPFVFHPNHSGVRHLVFPLGLLVLQSVSRLTISWQVMVLSFAGVFLILFNFETAIAVLCGSGFYIYLQCTPIDLRKILSLSVAALAGAFAALLVFWIIYGVGLGSWLTPSSVGKGIQDFLRRLSGGITGARLIAPGYQNINMVFVPLALMMFVHASFLTIEAAVRAQVRRLSPRELELGATAVILLIWLGYFFNFPAPWNLWISVFLYGVILAYLFNRRWIRTTLSHPAQALRRPWPILATLCVLMGCASIYSDWFNFNRGFLAPGWRATDPGATLAGVVVSTKLIDPLVKKAAYLKAKSAAGRVVYTTLNTDFMPILSGIYQPGPERDFWTMVTSDEEMRQAVENLRKKNPDWLLTDDEAGPLVFTGQRRVFQDHVQRIVGEYFTLVDRGAGWKVWVPKKP